jgi:phosphoserine phosphatase RsbU/P
VVDELVMNAILKSDVVPASKRIVVADDSTPVRLLLTLMLQSLGYEVVQAQDGEEAYARIVEGQIQMVVCDWRMPRLDGQALCRRLREAGLEQYTYFILVSVRDNHAHFVEGMDAGADDFLFKPVDLDQLRVRLRAGERVLKLERNLAERNQTLALAYREIRENLDSAASMQRSLLPAKSPRFENVHCEWFVLPSLHVSGDELNAFQLDADHIGFYNFDVAGHGVAAAMMSATVSHMLSPSGGVGLLIHSTRESPAPCIRPPAEVARLLNRQFQVSAEMSMYFTMVYAVLNIRTGVMRFVRAGHTSPICVTSRRECTVLEEGSPPIGLLADFEFIESQLTLSRGDRIFIYSDGITECEGPDGQQFGEDRLQEFLVATHASSLEETLNSLEKDLCAWRGEGATGFLDDVSMLAIEYR